jgi:7-keto-8-aminopelargonate synthetase-like enzyme
MALPQDDISAGYGNSRPLPVLVKDNDAVLIDQFAHASLHTASELLRQVPVHVVRHSRLDQVDKLVRDLSPQHEGICADYRRLVFDFW